MTNTGPTTVTGDVGTFPTVAITGFGSVTLIGTNQNANAVTQIAKLDLLAAYHDAAVRPPSVTYPGEFDLVGLKLVPGVYRNNSSLFLSGTVTLDARGDPEAVWFFQAGSSLITASGSQVLLTKRSQGLPCILAGEQLGHPRDEYRLCRKHPGLDLHHRQYRSHRGRPVASAAWGRDPR